MVRTLPLAAQHLDIGQRRINAVQMPGGGAVITGGDSAAIESVLAAFETLERFAILVEIPNNADFSVIQSQSDVLFRLFMIVRVLAKRARTDALKVLADGFGQPVLLGVGATDAVE